MEKILYGKSRNVKVRHFPWTTVDEMNHGIVLILHEGRKRREGNSNYVTVDKFSYATANYCH